LVAVLWNATKRPSPETTLPTTFRFPPQGGEKSAEVVVVEETSRSAHEHVKVAGGSHPMKDRTNEEGIDPVTDKPTDNARRRGELESRDGGSRSAAETARRATMETLKNEP
jgi:hypothetical protein